MQLIPISEKDLQILDFTEYKNLSVEKRKLLVQDSKKGSCNGEYFRFYIVKVGTEAVGVINTCGHGVDAVSVAPEIFEKFRNQGFATKSLNLAYDIAKDTGFETVIAGIRKENVASQKLHQKLGFTFVEEFVSKNGKPMIKYVKKL